MRFLICFSFCLLVYQFCGAQSSCRLMLNELAHEIETNSASYQDQVVNAGRYKEYIQHRDKIYKAADGAHDNIRAAALAAEYLSFLRDAHLSIHYRDSFFPFRSFSDSEQVRAWFKSWPKFEVPERNKAMPIEGDWYLEDGTLAMSIFTSKSEYYDYAGVVKETTQAYWQPGHIKLELQAITDTTFNCIYWSPKLRPIAAKGRLDHGKLMVGRMVFYRDPKENKKSGYINSEKLEFRALSAKTSYLHIPSFDPQDKKSIDSIIKAKLPDIQQRPNLIIDLRGNGGGSDGSYYELLPLVFDKKAMVWPIAASVWVSPGNLHWYDSTRYQYCENKKDSMAADADVNELRKYLNHFTPDNFQKDTLDTVYAGIKKVALLVDRNCASSTEGFIILSRQSSKVKRYGENTYGAISYGDWRRVDIPGQPIWISNTTKKMNFYTPMDIESIGIKPDVDLSEYYCKDWEDKVREDMERK